MKKIVLFPNRIVASSPNNLERFPIEEFEIFYVEDGPVKLEGVRFDAVLVHWGCFGEPLSPDCIDVILHTITFAKKFIPTSLFL